MGQFDVLDYLRAHPKKWFTIEELDDVLLISKRNIRKHVIKLEAQRYVEGRLRHVSFTKKPREFKILL